MKWMRRLIAYRSKAKREIKGGKEARMARRPEDMSDGDPGAESINIPDMGRGSPVDSVYIRARVVNM
jgi:hypothetical protein